METRPGAACRLGRTRWRGLRGRGLWPGRGRQRGPRRRADSSSRRGTAQRPGAGALAEPPGRVLQQSPPLLQQLLAPPLPPPLQLLPQRPPRAPAPPAADPPRASAPPPRGRGAASTSRAHGRPAPPQKPGARGALAAAPAPAARRRLGPHSNAARSPGARGRLAPRALPIPSGLLAWETPPDLPALCGGLVTSAPPGTSQIRAEAGRPVPQLREQASPGTRRAPVGPPGTRGPRVLGETARLERLGSPYASALTGVLFFLNSRVHLSNMTPPTLTRRCPLRNPVTLDFLKVFKPFLQLRIIS